MEDSSIEKQMDAIWEVHHSNSLRAVTHERVEQISKHGYDVAHDDAHDTHELEDAAAACLTIRDTARFWPWDDQLLRNIRRKSDYDRLTIAAALILAEMDRLDRVAGGAEDG